MSHIGDGQRRRQGRGVGQGRRRDVRGRADLNLDAVVRCARSGGRYGRGKEAGGRRGQIPRLSVHVAFPSAKTNEAETQF